MKTKLTAICTRAALLSALIFACATTSTAQSMTEVDSNVTLEMADGTTVKGWNRSKFMNDVRFIEISDTPKGERRRYDNDQVNRAVFDDGTVFVKKDIRTRLKGNKVDEGRWVRVEYEGRGISVYSAYSEGWEQLNTMRRKVQQRTYYLALGDDNPIWASTHYMSGGVLNAAGANRTILNYIFTKIYPQYADFAARIKNKEFDTKENPMEVVRAWEEAYGGR